MNILRSLIKPKVFIPLVLAIALIAALLSVFNIQKVLMIMAGFQRMYLLYYFLLMLAYETVRGAQWNYMLNCLKVRASLRSQVFAFALAEVTKILPIGNYFQNYVLSQSKGANFGLTSAATTLIILEEIAVSLAGVVILGLGSWTGEVRIIVLGGSAVFIAIVWAIAKFRHDANRPEWISKRPPLNKVADEFARFREGASDLMNPRLLTITLAYSTTYLIIGGAELYVVVRGLNIPNVSFTQALAVYLFSLAFALMFPMPIDFGAIEVSGLGAFIAIGVEQNAALSAVLANRILSLFSSIVIAAVVVVILRKEVPPLFRHISENSQANHSQAPEAAESGDGGDGRGES